MRKRLYWCEYEYRVLNVAVGLERKAEIFVEARDFVAASRAATKYAKGCTFKNERFLRVVQLKDVGEVSRG